MGFPTGSPKVYAQEIAKGYVRLSPINLRRYAPAELKVLNNHLTIVDREARQMQINDKDFDALRNKNQMLQRLKSARLVLHTFCKKRRVPL
ncbi:MAG: hypothetical protein P9M14_02045 [Candidatus Alcyoniella australis]|nr:hypothetical protein [Candidatus Alcyoniella australis]